MRISFVGKRASAAPERLCNLRNRRLTTSGEFLIFADGNYARPRLTRPRLSVSNSKTFFAARAPL